MSHALAVLTRLGWVESRDVSQGREQTQESCHQAGWDLAYQETGVPPGLRLGRARPRQVALESP